MWWNTSNSLSSPKVHSWQFKTDRSFISQENCIQLVSFVQTSFVVFVKLSTRKNSSLQHCYWHLFIKRKTTPGFAKFMMWSFMHSKFRVDHIHFRIHDASFCCKRKSNNFPTYLCKKKTKNKQPARRKKHQKSRKLTERNQCRTSLDGINSSLELQSQSEFHWAFQRLLPALLILGFGTPHNFHRYVLHQVSFIYTWRFEEKNPVPSRWNIQQCQVHLLNETTVRIVTIRLQGCAKRELSPPLHTSDWTDTHQLDCICRNEVYFSPFRNLGSRCVKSSFPHTGYPFQDLVTTLTFSVDVPTHQVKKF